MRKGDDRESLFHILEAIDRIERDGQRGRQVFDSEELIQSWIVHHLQILGEASRELSEDFKAKNPQVPWKSIIGMRNVLVHDYMNIDLDVAWTAAPVHAPPLRAQVEQMLAQFPT